MALDFSMAKLKHASWKMKLRDHLDGKPGLTAAQATSDHDCDLGKWIFTEGKAKYGTLPDMKALETEHAALHKLIKTVMDLKAAGKTKEAEVEFHKFEPLSSKVVKLLASVEAQAAKKAA